MEFRRYFTRQEAERALPLVGRIVADILSVAGRIRALEPDDVSRADHEAELQGYYEELEAVGCYYKDWSFTVGLVDFPARIEGETVFLCWRSDEKELAFYHGIEDGYQGRRPLTPNPAPG